jgi:hypothetical protein
MELIQDGGRTVVCPECYAFNRLDAPVEAGQVVLCQACRVRIVIEAQDGKLVPVVLPDTEGEEDTTW